MICSLLYQVIVYCKRKQRVLSSWSLVELSLSWKFESTSLRINNFKLIKHQFPIIFLTLQKIYFLLTRRKKVSIYINRSIINISIRTPNMSHIFITLQLYKINTLTLTSELILIQTLTWQGNHLTYISDMSL